MSNKVNFVDTTLRDGNQSLWACLMSTSMILPVASHIDNAGYSVVEIISPVHYKTIVREVRENPWEKIRLVSQRISAPLAVMQQCSITGFKIVPKCMVKLWFERLAANGIKRLHLMEASNDMSLRVPYFVQYAKDVGIEVAIALTYSTSPKHTDEYFARKAKDAVNLGVDAIYIKDPGGLLTPEGVRTLVPAVQQNANGVPIEFHSHCTTGLAPLCYLEAVRQGIKTLHVATPPLANSSSQPSVLNVNKNLSLLGYSTDINEEAIKSVAKHFEFVAKREGRPIGVPVEYDYYQYVHQIPGGVISNLKRQLNQLRMLDRLDEVIEESIRVREEFGYPIMVTPFSQFVVTQASINVMLGQRYKQVIDDWIYYALGFWGEEASSEIDPDIKDKIMSTPRAKELNNWEPPEPSIGEVREQMGGIGISDDDLLLKYMVDDDDDIKAMRAAGPIREREYANTDNALIVLVRELAKQRELGYVGIQKQGVSLVLQK